VPTETRIQIDFSAASGGLLASFAPYINPQYGTDNPTQVAAFPGAEAGRCVNHRGAVSKKDVIL